MLRVAYFLFIAVSGADPFAVSQDKSVQQTKIEELIKQLHSSDFKVRTQATKALVKFGDKAIAALSKALDTKDKETRFVVAVTLARFGAKGKAAVPDLIEFLNKGNGFHQRLAAADALGMIGEDALPAVPHLLKRLPEDWQTFIGPHMAPALRKIGPKAAPHVLKLLNKSPDKHTGVLVGLLAGYDLKYPLELLKHESPAVRLAALRVFAGTKGRMELTIKMLDDPAPKVRGLAAYAMRHYSAKAAVAVPQLCKLLKDEHLIVRSSAAFGLGGIGPAAKAAGDDLAALLKDDRVRLEASWALMQIGRIEDAVTGFIKLLDANDRVSRYTAAMRLGEIGPSAKTAIPKLVETLQKDKDSFVRRCVAEALEKMGDAARPAIVSISNLLNEKNTEVQIAVAKTVVKLRPETKEHIQAILKAGAKWRLEQIDPAVFYLEKLRFPPQTAKPLLLETLRTSDNIRLRIFTAHWLVCHGESKPGFAVYREMLKHKHEGVIYEAVSSLGRLKELGKPLAEELRPLLEHQNENLRRAAATALKELK